MDRTKAMPLPPVVKNRVKTCAVGRRRRTRLGTKKRGSPLISSDESHFRRCRENGGEEEIRTLDPHVANVMLYQLSYFPIRGNVE